MDFSWSSCHKRNYKYRCRQEIGQSAEYMRIDDDGGGLCRREDFTLEWWQDLLQQEFCEGMMADGNLSKD